MNALKIRLVVASAVFGLASPSLGAPDIADVAPAQCIALLRVGGLTQLKEALEHEQLLSDKDLDAINAYILESLDILPAATEAVMDGFRGGLAPLDVVSQLSLSVAVWLDEGPTGKPEIAWAGWLDLQTKEEALLGMWESAWEGARAHEQVDTVMVGDATADRITLGDEDEVVPLRPSHLLHAKEDSLACFATSVDAMERVLDVVAGTSVEGPLSDEEAYAGLTGLLEQERDVLAMVFVEPLFDAIEARETMGVASMVRASFDEAIGPIRGIGLAAGAGGDGLLASWSAAIWMPEGYGGLMRLLRKDSEVAPLPGWIGQDVWSIIRFNVSFGHIPDWIRSVVASNPMLMGVGQMLNQFEPTLRAILDPLGERLLTVSSIQRPLTPESLRSLTVIACEHPTNLSDAIAANAPETGMEPREFQGHQIWTMEGGGLPLPLPMDDGPMSLAVAGGALLVGDDAAVEGALRGIGTRSATPARWLARVLDWLPGEPVAAWGGTDLQSQFGAAVEVQRMNMARWESQVKEADPELWEEIREELESSSDGERLERMAEISQHLGPAAWAAVATSEGFRIRGVLMADEEE